MIFVAFRNKAVTTKAMPMTDEGLQVNPAVPFESGTPTGNSQPRLQASATVRRNLVDEPASPIQKSAELIRIDYEINHKRHWGQHESQVSHGESPCAR
jgi:hypothetical protein